MSTKILNGFRINRDVYEFADEIRKKLLPVREQEDKNMIANIFCKELDDYVFRKRDKQPSLADIWIEYTEKQQSLQTSSWEHDVNRFDYSFFKDKPTGIVVGIYYCENEALKNTFWSIEGVEDFHYQNSVDRPKEISKEEWTLRKDVWNRVLPHTPLESMFSFNLKAPGEIPSL